MSYYNVGNSFKWFIGRVADIKDPEQLGRVKVRVIHEQTGDLGKKSSRFGITDEELLWAWPISSIQSASLHWKKIAEKELENFDVPDYVGAVGISPTGIAVGTYVFGFYLDGMEQNIPMIFGTYHKKSVYPEPPSDLPESKMLQLDKTDQPEELHDVAELARGENSLAGVKKTTQTKGKEVDEPSSAYAAEYPYNTTFTTKGGTVIELDDTPGAERIHIWHKSGSYEEINQSGRRVTKTVGDRYEIVASDDHVLIKGDATIEVQGNIKIVCNGNTDIKTSGDTRIETAGKTKVQSTGQLDLESSVKIKARAPSIDIN